MTIIMIEATAEELSANRTILDSVNDAINKFTESKYGVSTDISKVYSERICKSDDMVDAV